MNAPASNHAETPGDGPAAPAPAPARALIASRLAALRRRARAWLVSRAASTVLLAALAAVLVAVLLDYFIRLPAAFRVATWLIGATCLVIALRRMIVPAWRFAPSLTEMALRVERSEHGSTAGLRGWLAAGLELADHQRPSAVGPAVASEAHRRLEPLTVGALVDAPRARRAVLALIGALAVAALLAGLTPTYAAIGLQRTLAPWSGAQWPRRTGVEDATGTTVQALGVALLLRADLTRTDEAPGRTRVEARYRITRDGRTGPIVRTVMNSQGREQVALAPRHAADHAPAGPDRAAVPHPATQAVPASGELYEAWIKPDVSSIPAPSTTSDPAAAETATLEYWFTTKDDATDAARVTLVPPPAITSASATVTPPAYVTTDRPGGEDAARPSGYVSGRLDLGTGTDQRAIVGPVLAGSRVTIAVTLNKTVPTPAPADPEALAAWLAAAAPGLASATDLKTNFDGPRWMFSWTADQNRRVALTPRDDFGLAPADESAFTFEMVEDRPPVVVVARPGEDTTVLPTAVIELAGEARDDIALKSLRLEHQTATPTKGSLASAPEPSGDPALIADALPEAGAVATRLTTQATLDLGPLGLEAGQEVWVRAIAADTFTDKGAPREPVSSTPRKLRIITPEVFAEQVRSELGTVRRAAIRLDEDESSLEARTKAGSVSADDRRGQRGIAERAKQQGDLVERLRERAAMNRLGDEGLRGLLEDVQSALQDAKDAADRAAEQMDAAAGQREKADLTPAQAEAIGQSQQATREALMQVVQMLDRGEDAWLARRELQRLIDQQRGLADRTRQAGERTVGREMNELTPRERQELSELAERQRQLSEQARKALQELGERAGQMKAADPAQAAAMDQAARQGQEQQVPQTMQQAAENAQQNRTSEAQEQQQRAMSALQQMMETLDSAKAHRDEALRRQLATLLESLDALIASQEQELDALANAAPETFAEAAPPLAAAMVTLNQNTLAVLDMARSGFRETASLADLIDRAAGAQSRAVVALRAAPPEPEPAKGQETESLRLLRLARAEVEQLMQAADEREAERRQQELRKVYQESLETQVAIRGDTEPFVGKAIDRRERARLRAIGDQQESLRQTLADLRRKTEEIGQTRVFDFAHERLDRLTSAAAKKLRAGSADAGVARDQASAVRVLESLVKALSDRPTNDDEFREGPQPDGGGSGGGSGQPQPLIPNLAKLRGLRGLQQEAAERTRAVAESGPRPSEQEVRDLADLQAELEAMGRDLINELSGPAGQPRPTRPGVPKGEGGRP